MQTCKSILWAAKVSLGIYCNAEQAFSSGNNCFDWAEVDDTTRKPIRGISIYKYTGKFSGIHYAYESWVGDSEGERHRERLIMCNELNASNILKSLLLISDKA